MNRISQNARTHPAISSVMSVMVRYMLLSFLVSFDARSLRFQILQVQMRVVIISDQDQQGDGVLSSSASPVLFFLLEFRLLLVCISEVS